MSKLVIAEKPMLARDIARAITGKEVSESARLPISGNGYTVCACAGHLLELVKPDAIDPKWGMPWSLDVLPIEVHDWPKEPAVDKKTGESKKPLIDQIAGLLKTCDSVIAAGDPDDEGQLIVDELLDYLHSKAFNDGNVTAHHGIIPQEADAPVSAMEPDEAKVYTAICERYAVQFLPPAVYDVSESTVSVDGGTLKLTAKRLSDAGFTAVFPNISNSRVREDSDTGNPWVPAGSHTLAGISCSITEGETTPPAPYTEGTLITDMASIAKYVKDPEIREILKRKDDGKKGEHGGIGTTATRSSIIEGLKTRGYLEERKGKVRATDKAKAFYALLPPEIRGADVTARWWLIQQDIADGKADVNALQDSVIEVFNHHRETAYVGASIAGAGKTVVGKCPRCGKDVIKTGSIYACSSIKNEKQEDGTWKEVAGCGFKLFGFCTKKFTEKQAASLLDGKAVSLKGCKSKAGKTFDCTVVLQKDGSVEPIFTPRKPTKKGRR